MKSRSASGEKKLRRRSVRFLQAVHDRPTPRRAAGIRTRGGETSDRPEAQGFAHRKGAVVARVAEFTDSLSHAQDIRYHLLGDGALLNRLVQQITSGFLQAGRSTGRSRIGRRLGVG